MIERDLSGEMRIEPRWTTCQICGTRTPQPPVCFDLRCEIEIERMREEEE